MKKIGSRQGEREISNGIGKHREAPADSAAYNDSEGEAGDHQKFAERANGKGISCEQMLKPLPHFERSVFDKYQEQKDKNNNVWNKTSIEPQSDNKINLANERKKVEEQQSKKKKGATAPGAEEPYGCIVKGQNKHQLLEYPEGFPLAHP